MNLVADFIAINSSRLQLEPSLAQPASYVALTPRFRASKHVVFLVVPRGSSEPALVAKVSRLPGIGNTLWREAANLEAAALVHGGQIDTIPRLIAYQQFRDHELLIETALAGPAMDPVTVRRRCGQCCNDVFQWLSTFQLPTASEVSADGRWFARLVGKPLLRFETALAASPHDQRRIESLRGTLESLASNRLPLVFAHGDLSHPNLIMLKQGGVGVVDWELADERGLPLEDALFFLTYVAFARAKAATGSQYVAAVDRAFFGPAAWAMPYLAGYARRLGIAPADLPPLLAACWSRQISQVISRLDWLSADEPLDRSMLAWLHQNRYYLVWRHAIANFARLQCDLL